MESADSACLVAPSKPHPPKSSAKRGSVASLGRLFSSVSAVVFWGYVAIVVALYAAIMLQLGSRFSPMTVFLFAPRWIVALPLLPVLLIALCRPKSRLLFGVIAAWIVAFPILGLRANLPTAETTLEPKEVQELRLLTSNVEGDNGITQLEEMIAGDTFDFVALQECNKKKIELPAGWHHFRDGRLLVASRYPIRDIDRHRRHNPPSKWPPVNGVRCRVETPFGLVGICNVHMQSPRPTLERILTKSGLKEPLISMQWLQQTNENRDRESEELVRWLNEWDDLAIVAGDFNTPTESHIYRRDWSQFKNGFDQAGTGFGFTKWTEFRSFNYGMRIDHILTSKDWRTQNIKLGQDIGSDHLPVMATVAPIQLSGAEN